MLCSDKRRYDRRLVSAAEAALEGAQVFLFVVDIAKRWGHLEAETLLRVAEAAAAAEAPLLMALNKVDRLTGAHNWHGLAGRHKQRKQREMLLLLEAKTDAVSDAWGGALQVAGSAVEPPCTPIHTTSAVNGDGMPQLKRALQSCAPAGAWQFPAGVVSDRSNEARVHEAIREQLFRHLHKEVPYQARQVNRSWRLNGRGELIIHQDIQLPRAPQVSMLLARGCAALEAVSMGARDTLEGIFNRRVHLFLHVAHKPELVSRGVSVEDDFDANLGQGGVFAPAPAAMFQPSGDAVRLNVEEKHADIQDAMAELRGALGGAPAAGGAGGGAARRVGGLQLQRDAALLGPHAVWRPADN